MNRARDLLLGGRRTMVGALFLTIIVLTPFGIVACDSGGSTSGPSATSSGPTVDSATSRGKQVYERYCEVCHPGGNRGAGPSLREEAPRMADDRLRSVVRSGKSRMPGFGPNEITDDDLTQLVAYIRTLK